MKFSHGMLKGFEKVGGKHCKDAYCKGDPSAPTAVCVWGAWQLAANGNADDENGRDQFDTDFEEAWGIPALRLNDEGMPWEHIYGMAVAAGL